MFCRSLLTSRRLVQLVAIPKATLSRNIIRPRISRVLDKDGRPLNADPPPPPPRSMLDPKYDESFLFDDQEQFEEPPAQVSKFVKSTSGKSTKGNVPRYEKADDRKNEFKSMMTNLALRKRRETLNLVVLEGKRLINDAIDAGIRLKIVYFTLEENLKDIKNLEEIMTHNGTRLMKVLYRDMKIFSNLMTSPGIMAVAEKPDYDKLDIDASNRMPLTLICDNIRDPGNMGTIIRSSAAAGVGKIILTSGCVDAWNSKVIKASSGAHFRIPLHANVAWSSLATLLPQQYDLYIADAKHEHNFTSADAESIQSHDYFDVNFFEPSATSRDKVLIIANEAFGPSLESYQLAEKCSGSRITIPLFGNVDSLNSAVASSILLFEIRKQFLNAEDQ